MDSEVSQSTVGSRRGLIRPSSLPTFSDCPRRFAARHLADMAEEAGYELRREMRRHIGAAVGTAVHAGVAFTLTAKRDTGELGNATEAEHLAEIALIQGVQEGAIWDDTSPNVPVAKLQATRMVRSYRRHVAPNIVPLLIEERRVADIGDSWQVSGQADTLTGDPDDHLRDLKTGARKRANAPQYGAYVLVFEAHGYAVPRITEDFLPRVRKDAEQPPPVAIAIDRRSAVMSAWDIIGAVKAATAEFERRVADPHGLDPLGAFLPNPNSALCGEKWCPAWGTKFCRAHA